MEATTSSRPPSVMGTPSTRSRASSVISTGTKTSIGTIGTYLSTNLGMTPLSPTDQNTTTTAGNSIDVLLGRRNFRISTRPGSVLSISSFDYPAPPYHEAIKTPALPVDFGSVPSIASAQTESSSDTQSSNATAVADSNTDRPSTSDTIVAAESRQQNTSAPSPTIEVGDEDEDQNQDARSIRSVATSMTHPSALVTQSHPESSRNALSRYYTDIVQQIDSNHQNEMAQERASHEAHLKALRTELEVAHESELDDLRSSLENQHTSIAAQLRNDIDTVYRAEFAKMRDETAKLEEERKKLLDDVKAATLIATHHEKASKKLESDLKGLKDELAVAKAAGDERELRARNQVEDMWEARWKQRMELAAEQVGKSEREASTWADLVEERWGREAMLELRQTAKDRVDAEELEREATRRTTGRDYSALPTPTSPSEKPLKKKIWPPFGTVIQKTVET